MPDIDLNEVVINGLSREEVASLSIAPAKIISMLAFVKLLINDPILYCFVEARLLRRVNAKNSEIGM